ncbi:unnamed protein product [Didymodactylos carnosus]|uniref:Uncharacterized protein n=1 Tax=Didymodactylos carnosus TaxID=1234261 RepID=A0A814T6R5_9BILA|nr:unnamed protein product [Didymodactylos carnosus]CAF1157391.1 unnamed protein product [Didymodactylos carnosus]CAF3695243.1 unnamed protein product [Didymodactylos carnosus]CAF3920828.1 unnamed protein product [Didymodactylos carnosus]
MQKVHTLVNLSTDIHTLSTPSSNSSRDNLTVESPNYVLIGVGISTLVVVAALPVLIVIHSRLRRSYFHRSTQIDLLNSYEVNDLKPVSILKKHDQTFYNQNSESASNAETSTRITLLLDENSAEAGVGAKTPAKRERHSITMSMNRFVDFREKLPTLFDDNLFKEKAIDRFAITELYKGAQKLAQTTELVVKK